MHNIFMNDGNNIEDSSDIYDAFFPDEKLQPTTTTTTDTKHEQDAKNRHYAVQSKNGDIERDRVRDEYYNFINENYQEIDIGVGVDITKADAITGTGTGIGTGKPAISKLNKTSKPQSPPALPTLHTLPNPLTSTPISTTYDIKERKQKEEKQERQQGWGNLRDLRGHDNSLNDSKQSQLRQLRRSEQYTFPTTNFSPVSFADEISVDLANLCLDDSEQQDEIKELSKISEDASEPNSEYGETDSKADSKYDSKATDSSASAASNGSTATAPVSSNANAHVIISNANVNIAANASAFSSTNTAAWRFLKRNCYRRTKARLDESNAQPKYRSYLNRGNDKASYSTEANITKANKLLDELLPPRSSVQVRLHEAYIRSCAPHIVGFSTWGKIRNKWLRKWKMKDSNLACLLLAPRRFGKSISTAMFGALLMYICPFLTTAILSTNQMMSQILMRMIISFYVQWPKARDRILKANQEEFIVRLPDDDFKLTNAQVLASGRYNILRARASTVQSNKGVTAGVWFLDEASRINEMVLQEVVFPTLSVTYTVMLAITTPLNSNNYYSQLFERPDTSECFIKVNINLYCDDCKQKGIDPRLCRHLDYLRPSWMNSDAIDRVRPLMSPEMFAREMMAAITSADSALFSVEVRRQLRAKAPASLMRWKETMSGPEICFTFFDPAGKGESEGALASVVLTSNREVIICGLATCPLPNVTHVDGFVKNYVTDLVKLEGLKTSQHLLIVERNLGPIYIDQAMTSFAEVCEDVECYEGRSASSGRSGSSSGSVKQGAWTTRLVIERACETLQFDLLAGNIYFADEMVLQDQGETKPHEVMDKFFQQLGQIKKDKDGKYTGKHNGKQDDLFMAFVFTVYWGRQTLRKWENETAALDRREEYLSIFARR